MSAAQLLLMAQGSRSVTCSKALDLYGNVESDMMVDIEDYGLAQAQIAVHEMHHDHIEAARVCLAEGNLIGALRTFLKDSKLESYLEAAECLLSGLWRLLPLWSTPTGSATERDLMEILETLKLDTRFDQLTPRKRNQASLVSAANRQILTDLFTLHSYPYSAPF